MMSPQLVLDVFFFFTPAAIMMSMVFAMSTGAMPGTPHTWRLDSKQQMTTTT
jgi:hypothetical protein